MAVVSSIFIYPDQGEPGQGLDDVEVSEAGLDDDRRKSAPVHLVSVAAYVHEHPRANLVLDLETDELTRLIGRRLRIGTVELEVTGPAKNCPGVYASVPVPGGIAVGDEVTVGVES
ncbi:MAG: hypothetical protein ABI083_01775 [Lapillicoccus sp.]